MCVRWTMVAAALGVSVAGCSFRMGDMTALATRNVQVPSRPLQRQVEGRDCVLWILGLIPTGSLVPNVQEATDRALAQVPDGNAMTDVAIYVEPLVVPLIFTRSCVKVRGEVVRVTKGGAR